MKFKILIVTIITVLGAACGGSSAPTVSSVTPADAATGVARTSTITATFDEDMLSTSIDGTSFTLANSSTTAGTVTFDGSRVATFTPTNKLAAMSTYTATLSTGNADLSGNALANDYTWSFTTADRTWGTAELIETEAGSAEDPQIAFDSSGNAIAVWFQFDATSDNILARRFDGTNWGTAGLIETDNAGDAYGPQIAFDSSGNAIAVWYQYDGGRTDIWANHFDGTSWGTAGLIETDNAGDAWNAQIAFDSSGNAIAVWQQKDSSSRWNIWANHFDGTSWDTAGLIETDNAGNAEFPQIAFDSSGNAIAVWQQSNGSLYSIWARRFNGTSWDTTAELSETGNAGGDAGGAQIAFDSSGNALAVWYQDDGSGRTDIWANRFNGTIWDTAKLIETDNAGDAGGAQIAFDSSGNAIAVWQQKDDSSRWNILANRFDGTNWGNTAEPIETDDDGNAKFPQIAFDSSGNAIAVWYQDDGSGRTDIWANRFE